MAIVYAKWMCNFKHFTKVGSAAVEKKSVTEACFKWESCCSYYDHLSFFFTNDKIKMNVCAESTYPFWIMDTNIAAINSGRRCDCEPANKML